MHKFIYTSILIIASAFLVQLSLSAQTSIPQKGKSIGNFAPKGFGVAAQKLMTQ